MFYGNSITDAWAAYFPTMFPGKPYVGRGISGQTTPQMLVRFRQDVIALEPAVVVILAGTNDIAGNTGPSTQAMIADNLRSMVELARANDIRVVLSSVLPASDYGWRPGLDPGPKIVALNAWMREYAEGHDVVFWADLFRRDPSLMSPIPEGAVGVVWNYEAPGDVGWAGFVGEDPVTGWPEMDYICVSDTGRVAYPYGPTDFNTMLANEDLSTWDDEAYFMASKLYIHLDTPIRQHAGWVFLNSGADFLAIDFNMKTEPLQARQELARRIAPAKRSSAGDQQRVEMYTWSNIGGMVHHWTLGFSADRIDAKQTELGRFGGGGYD